MEDLASDPNYQSDANNKTLGAFWEANDEIFDRLASGNAYDDDQYFQFELDEAELAALQEDERLGGDMAQYAADNWLVTIATRGKKQAKEDLAADAPMFGAGDRESQSSTTTTRPNGPKHNKKKKVVVAEPQTTSPLLSTLSDAEIDALSKKYDKSLGSILAHKFKNPKATVADMVRILENKKSREMVTDAQPQSALSHTLPMSPSFVHDRTLCLWAELPHGDIEFICLLSLVQHGGTSSAYTVRHGLFSEARYFATLTDCIKTDLDSSVVPLLDKVPEKDLRLYLKLLAAVNDSARFCVDPITNESMKKRFGVQKINHGGFDAIFMLSKIEPPVSFFEVITINHSDPLDIWTCAPGTQDVYKNNILAHDVKSIAKTVHGLPPVQANYFSHQTSTHSNAGICGLAMLNSMNKLVGWHALGTPHNKKGSNWAVYAHEAVAEIHDALKASPGKAPLNF
jgi:hypothetical protein